MQPEVHQVKAVLFDADGVVQRSAAGWLDTVKKLCGDPSRSDEFMAEVFAAEHPTLLGQGTFPQALSDVLKRWNSGVTLQDALAVWTMIEPDNAVFERIRALRLRGTRVALATNQQEHRATYMLDDLGYSTEFDHVFCSCRLGWSKPSQEYFLRTLEELDLPPEHVLFIDDHHPNTEAAKAVGLQAVQFHLDQGVAVLDDLLAAYGLGM